MSFLQRLYTRAGATWFACMQVFSRFATLTEAVIDSLGRASGVLASGSAAAGLAVCLWRRGRAQGSMRQPAGWMLPHPDLPAGDCLHHGHASDRYTTGRCRSAADRFACWILDVMRAALQDSSSQKGGCCTEEPAEPCGEGGLQARVAEWLRRHLKAVVLRIAGSSPAACNILQFRKTCNFELGHSPNPFGVPGSGGRCYRGATPPSAGQRGV